MRGRMNRWEFLKQSAITATVLSASHQTLFGATQEFVRESLKTVAEIDNSAIRQFASHLRGRALLPGEPGYEPACQLWTGQNPNRPGLFVRCTGPQDIATTVNFVRDQGLLLAVRGGGHSRDSTCEGGVLINLSDMRKIAVKPAKYVARVQAGLTVADVDKATSAFGLASVLSECPSVGISGLTHGGGLGRRMGQHGALCDNLLSAEVVTADGLVRRASAQENGDLFWAIRGGSGNFGIVTSFEYRLHPVGQVLSGMLRYPISEVRAVLRFFWGIHGDGPRRARRAYRNRQRHLAVCL